MLHQQDIQLIGNRLRALGFKSLRQYYASAHWLTLKVVLFKRKKTNCYCCLSFYKLQLHHLTYERLGCEAKHDLVWLCDTCHEEVHIYYQAALHRWHSGLLREVTEHWKSICYQPRTDGSYDLQPTEAAVVVHERKKRSKKRRKPERREPRRERHVVLDTVTLVAPLRWRTNPAMTVQNNPYDWLSDDHLSIR